MNIFRVNTHFDDRVLSSAILNTCHSQWIQTPFIFLLIQLTFMLYLLGARHYSSDLEYKEMHKLVSKCVQWVEGEDDFISRPL